MNYNEIRYYIRIRNNFRVLLPHNNKDIKASHLFNQFKVNKFVHYSRIVRVNEHLCYLSGAKLYNRNGKREFLIIVSFNKHEEAQEQYKQRWQLQSISKIPIKKSKK